MFSARLRKITHNPGIDLLSFVTFEKNAESVKEMVLDEAGKGDERKKTIGCSGDVWCLRRRVSSNQHEQYTPSPSSCCFISLLPVSE